MIIWIASYPKSGNTWVRALLSYYFFSKRKNFDFEILRHIPNFNIGDFVNDNTIFKSNIDFANKALEVQEEICERYKINNFFKTHSALIKMNKNYFTNKSVSLGAIYIVRDPRNVITSYKNFDNQNYDKTFEIMINDQSFLYSNKSTQKKFKIKGMEIISSWSNHFNSWVHNKLEIPICLIRYEDLVKDTLTELKKMFEFIKKINLEKKTNFDFERAKLTIDETNFENLKKLEITRGFIENYERIDKQNNFFNLGEKNDWKLSLPINLKNKIESNFRDEMIELGYLKK